MCEQFNIHISDSNIEEIDLGDDAEEIDVLEWMASHHLSGEKLALMDSLKEEKIKITFDVMEKFYAYRD